MDNSYYKTNAFRIPFIHSNWFLNRRVKSRYKRYQDRRSNNELTNLAHEDLLKMDMLNMRYAITSTVIWFFYDGIRSFLEGWVRVRDQ